MNEKALKTLEYYKIIDMLEAFATSSIGKNKCRQLRPLDNLTEIETMQQETADALSRVIIDVAANIRKEIIPLQTFNASRSSTKHTA